MANRYPNFIKDIFINKEVNDEGVYGVVMIKDGLKVDVILDDFFPCVNYNTMFSHNSGNELWAMLFEKAYSKIRGSYDRSHAA